MTTQPYAVTAAELADLAQTTTDRITALASAGILRAGPDGRYRRGDVHRIRIVEAFLAAGISLEALARARDAGAISFDYYDRLHQAPSERSAQTYADVRAMLGPRAALFDRLQSAVGLAAPDPRARPPAGELALLLRLLDVAESTGEPELSLRALRLLGDAIRRATEAMLTVYDEAVARVIEPAEGLPSRDVYERYLEPWARFVQAAPELGQWLTARHLSNAIDGYSVSSTEHYLAAAGYVPPPNASPPAIAFVDLAGFTRLAEERGDEPVARIALAFADLAERHASESGGQVVKLLGDGVLLRFASSETAVAAVLSLMSALEPAPMPAGHAGIAAGPIIVRDGDVFGRTVNLASRIADVAQTGEVLVSEPVADAVRDAPHLRVEPAGPAVLQGFGAAVSLYRVRGR